MKRICSGIFLLLMIFISIPSAIASLESPAMCTPGGSDPNETQRHSDVSYKLLMERNRIDGKYEAERLDCGRLDFGTAPYAKCITEADEHKRIAILNLEKQQVDEEVLHKNKMAEYSTYCSHKPPEKLLKCQDQIDSENYHYATIGLQFKIQRNTLAGIREKEQLDCAINFTIGTKPYAGCLAAVDDRNNKKLLEIEKHEATEITAHKNKLIDIQSHCKNGQYVP